MKRILIIWALLISVCFAQSKAGFYVVGGKVITVQDTSSRKYLKAIEDAGVVPSVTQNFASNYLVTAEKAISTYSLMKAQYPFIGGTAGTHKFNLNDPRDLDAAYRLVFNGGLTHSANGIQGNGTNGWAETFLNPYSVLGTDNISYSIYSLTSNSGNQEVELSAIESLGSGNYKYNAIYPGFLNMAYSDNTFVSGSNGRLSFSNTNSKGYYMSNKLSVNHKIFKNGIVLASATNSSGRTNANSTFNVFKNPQSQPYYSSKQLAYISISDGLTDTQAILQSRAVTSFEGFLSRQ